MPLAASKRQRSLIFAAFVGLSLIPALGLATNRLADWALFAGGLAGYDASAKFARRILQVCALILVALLDRKATYSERTIRNAVAAAGVGTGVLAAVFIYATNPTVVFACAGLSGITHTVMMVGWGYYLCSVEPRQSAFALTVGFALSGLVSWLFSALPVAWIHALAIGSAPISAVCFIYEFSRDTSVARADEPLTRTSLSDPPVVLLLALAVCTLTGVFVHTLVPTNLIQQGPGYQALVAVIYLGICAIYLLWTVALGRTDADRLWPLFPAVVLGGLVCYTSFISQWPTVAMNILAATQNCTIVFCWLATASVVYRRRLPRVFSFCVANIVFAEPITLSITVRGMLDPVGHVAGSMVAIAVTLALALALVVLTVGLAWGEALKGRRATNASAPTPVATPNTDPLIAAIDSMAEDYALTKREQEVALHLARGRTFPETAEALGVSLDTVRTHVKCLYRKTGVHKKGHVIELIEERRPDRAQLE